ncbi:MAG: dTDP-4-dehydrorhamnose 3,5-epimerase [Crocinitomicaceae bacterium]|nr:dTDP-4-dehydrorhamnose 3,5-epimerase [Crocinitomicaceae bacterium]|tara:strand:+ start:21781 stop:22320 length:540 start_codon:yes stop_codon:yes gene_type:complete
MNSIIATDLPGVYEIDFFHVKDSRGTFVKTLHKDFLLEHELEGSFAESFYSINNKNVIRGMHFQYPPDDHAKIVYCTHGKLLDVILDLRKNSPTYSMYTSIELSASNYRGVYLPKGTAHGFCTLEDHTCMTYLTSTVHSPDNDGGILYNSFGFDWPVNDSVHSDRDLTFPTLKDFKTPF